MIISPRYIIEVRRVGNHIIVVSMVFVKVRNIAPYKDVPAPQQVYPGILVMVANVIVNCEKAYQGIAVVGLTDLYTCNSYTRRVNQIIITIGVVIGDIAVVSIANIYPVIQIIEGRTVSDGRVVCV